MSAPSSALLRTIAMTNLVPTLGLLPLRADTAKIGDLLPTEQNVDRQTPSAGYGAKTDLNDVLFGDAVRGYAVALAAPDGRHANARVAVFPSAISHLPLMLGIGWLIVGLIAVVAATQH